jgi:hypothetical protein
VAREAPTLIKPSPEARHLFNQMVYKADEDLHLSIQATLDLSVERVSAGHRDHEEVHELEEQQWIDPAPDGGWLLH